MLTGGVFGLGSIYDLITLPRQVRDANFQKAIINSAFQQINNGQPIAINQKENIELAALKVAKSNNGIITASELAIAANTSVAEAKKALDDMVSRGHAELRVRQSGSLVYVIPDLMDSDDPLID